MEHLLGVTEAAKRTERDVNQLLENDHTGEDDQPDSHDRYDVEEADLQDEVEGDNKARQRYQRLFWESVGEGEVRSLERGLLLWLLTIVPGTGDARCSRVPTRCCLGAYEV